MKVLTFKSSQGALGKVGSEKAPELVLKELKELYLSESGRVLNVEKFDVEVDNSNIFTSGENLEIAFKKNYSHSRIVVVGGDHSMTYFSFKAFASRENNSGLIIFDAHPDCMENFKVTHEDFVRVLIDENIEDYNHDLDYDIVGFTAMTWQALRVYKLAIEYRKKNIYTVIGGIHATIAPDDCIKSKFIDFIVRGEGEVTFLELLKYDLCIYFPATPWQSYSVRR